MKRFNINQFLLSCITIICFGQRLLAQKEAIKIACIGDSATAGYLYDNSDLESYPSQLQSLMGEKCDVKNFGNSGDMLLKNRHKPYYKTKEFTDAIAFNPDIAIIHLGLNDTDPRNWSNFKEEFDADYSWLLDILKNRNPVVKIYICSMTPIFNELPRFKSGIRDWYWQIKTPITNIAKANRVGLIDIYENLYSRPDLFPGALHPTKEGTAISAKTVNQNVTQDFGGLKLATAFTDNMVLQRNQPMVISGSANGGTQVEITFNQQKKNTITDKYRKWKVPFPAMSQRVPYDVRIQSKEKTIILKNILIGDEWFCSGQFNMAFQRQNSKDGNSEVKKTIKNTTIQLFNYRNLRKTDNTVWDSTTLSKTNQLKLFSGNWTVCELTNAKEFLAIAYNFGKKNAHDENAPNSLIEVTVGGSPIESWIDRYTLEHDDKAVDLLTNWRKSDFIMPWIRERAETNLKNDINLKQRHSCDPCYNYEAGVDDFTKFPIKGVIRYQSESNIHNIELCQHLLPLLVKNWRKAWKTDFPFYYIQLSGIDRPSWPALRDGQNRLQKIITKSGMLVSMDNDDSIHVHPIRKKEVAERLAFLA